MKDLCHRIATLSPEKRALLKLRLMQEGAAISHRRRIPRRGVPGPPPLSFAQQRLWFLDQLEPGSPVYNIVKALRVSGRFEVDVLQKALDTIVARHEAVRTTFTAVDGHPVQVIAESRRVELTLSDLRTLPAGEREGEVHRRLTAEARRPFNLSQDLLLRTTVLRLDEQEYVLLLVMHHIAADGWSLGILFGELVALYTAFSTGPPSPLPELPLQYADFAVWQRQEVQGEALAAQLTYWKRQLGGPLPVLELPTDRPRPAVQTYGGARSVFVLPPGLSAALKTLSRQQGVTLFMTLLAAFQTLLFRYTRQEDMVVGTPIANRTRAELEGLIGFFVNTVVLRTDLSGNPPFRELLRRVRERALEAYTHQELPFEKLVEELRPQRDLSHHPLFQVMLVLQNTPSPSLQLPGLTLSLLHVETGTAKFDLTLALEDTEHGLQGAMEYDTALFDARTIARMGGHFQTLLAGLVADPEQRLAEVPLLTAAERHQLLVAWNPTASDSPRAPCLHALFEAQVERAPEAVAVVCEGQQVTYGELNARANQLAHYLRRQGVGPEVLVGLCVERSVEMLVGLLGILKAGGAYVPLDPQYPKERLAFMLQDTQAPILLTLGRLLNQLPEHKTHLICLDADWNIIARESEQNPVNGATADNLAYVIYTSGSTGTPKGVLVQHRGLGNLSEAQRRTFDVRSDNRVLQFASLSFDASIFEIVMALTAGATLCLGIQDSLLPGPALIQLLRDQAITIITLPPSVLAALPTEELPALHTIAVAGEACSAEIVARWATGRQFFNLYGPTEATVWATIAECSDGSRRPPIGRPITNTQIYLLDSHLQPVPVGVPGELHLGGVGLARGYLNRPELTAERFVPHPFSAEPGACLYKTGDLARRRSDGSIEYLGRLDHQVKLRGFRIELGEIETVLSLHPSVQQVIVVAWEGTPGDTRLVAYIVPRQQPVPTVSELRNFLQTKLPEYMVPSAFVLLDALPLTPNDKVDRRALPAPDPTRPELETVFVAPRTHVEEVLVKLWAQVLGLDRLGIRDNFFALGGHSLLATQVISRLRDLFRVEVSLRRLFEAPTIAEFAVAIEQAQESKAELRPPAISPAARELHRVNISSRGA